MGGEAKQRAVHVSEDAILGYVEGRAAKREAIEAHLDQCDECRLLVAELARTSLLEANTEVPWGGPALDGTPTEPRSHVLPHPGARLADRFRIVKALGHGAMGMVYEAFDEALGVSVAVKVFWPSLSRDERVVDSIRREANLGRRIHHPNVRRVFDVESDGGFTFLTMELIDGESLEDRLRRAPVDEEQAIAILCQVCDALTAAHAAGIVHRDLKPGNIALDASGRVIVMDFGLARDVNAEASRAQGRGLVGTPAYWSPEQARGEAATPVSDLYSLGLIAYRLLTGRPFSLGGTNELVPPFRGIVNRCLELKPNKRYASALAVKSALLRARRSHVWLAGGGVAAFVALTIVGAVFVVRSSTHAPPQSAPPSANDRLATDAITAAPLSPPPPSTTSSSVAPAAPSFPVVSIEALPVARPALEAAPPRRASSSRTAEPRRSADPPPLANDPREERAPRRPQRPIDRDDPYATH